MNTWKKLPSGDWGVQCPAPQRAGDVVTVTNRDGKAKRVTLGAQVDANNYGGIYAVAEAPKAEARTVGDLGGLLALFDRAKCNSPALVVAVPGPKDTEGKPTVAFTFRLNVASDRAKVPGSLNVIDGVPTPWGSDERPPWYGRVLRDGTYQPSRDANGKAEPITERLVALARDPAKAARESAKLTGRCIFCNTSLSAGPSTAVGYGETCASNYGLPWGEIDTPF